MLIGRSDVFAELHFLEPVCPKFLDSLPTKSRSILLHTDRVLREVRGNGSRIVLVQCISMFFNGRDELFTWLWIWRVFLLGKRKPALGLALHPAGLEPATLGSEVTYSIQLS